jgi:hypothetical protein
MGGCDDVVPELYTCENARPEHTFGPDEIPDPCFYKTCPACTDARPNTDVNVCWSICQQSCEFNGGVCVPTVETLWSDPVVFGLGPHGQPLECPMGLTRDETVYSAHEVNEGVCPCPCAPPSSGSCELPSMITASTARCYDPNGTSIVFDAPASWDGACTTQDPIPAGAGVKSLSIPPLAMTEGDCSLVGDGGERAPASLMWQHSTRSCRWDSVDYKNLKCPVGKQCAPPIVRPSVFTHCIVHDGEKICPTAYPVRVLGYEEEYAIDERMCEPCDCSGKPTESKCTAQVSVYQDAVCSTAPVISGLVDSNTSKCLGDLDSPGLLSKAASSLTYTPGVCKESSKLKMGGQITASYDKMVTYCCLYEHKTNR